MHTTITKYYILAAREIQVEDSDLLETSLFLTLVRAPSCLGTPKLWEEFYENQNNTQIVHLFQNFFYDSTW